MTFDKDLYQYYQSASVHTGTKRYPIKQIATFVGAILFTVLLGGNFVYSKLAIANSGDKDVQPPEEQILLPKPTQAQETIQVQTPPLNQLLYRGHIKSSTELILMLEDPQTGQRFDLPDFDGYRKEGVEVVFYLAGTAQEYTYRVRDRELSALLP